MHKILSLLLPLLAFATGCGDDDGNTTPAITPSLAFQDADTEQPIDALTFDAAGGEKIVGLTSNVDWTLASDAEWLTTSNTSGQATTTYVKLTAKANESTEARTAIVTLSGQGAMATLTVTQSGQDKPDDSGFITATAAMAAMGNGMNIGNTLDSYGDWITGTSPKDFETAWGNPQITPQLIAAYKAAGVKTLRLPVTWRQHIDDDGNVDDAWMARVREVVDYIIDEGMFCILNVHHDCGGDDKAWLRADQDADNLATIKHKFTGLWTNIATEFQDYGDHLLFEGYNEMLDGSSRWTSTDAQGYAAHNELAQTFVSAVRATGGNNAHRNIIVCTYGADAHETTLSSFVRPTDTAVDHLIVEVHNYTPGEFVGPSSAADAKAWTDSYATEVSNSFALISKYLTSKGMHVIIGEFGCNSNVAEAEQVKYAEHFVAEAAELGIPAIHWFDLIDRKTCEWTLPNVMQVVVK